MSSKKTKGGKSSSSSSKPMPSAAYSVREDLRIELTRQLMQLREGEITSKTFPSTLSNVERKFVHALADELGLKSKSTGSKKVEGARRITVSKVAGKDPSSSRNSEFRLHRESRDILMAQFSSSKASAATIIEKCDKVEAMSRGARAGTHFTPLSTEMPFLELSYTETQEARLRKESFQRLQTKRAVLPAFEHRSAVTTLVKENQIVLISGETGCGKTTQVPQFLYDDPEIGPRAKIVICQPRRLSAIAVATRIAYERDETLGATVGYSIHLDSEKSRKTQILFVTPGVLLRKLLSDPLLEEFNHIIIDEAHERDRFSELLMIVLRDICTKRASLKLILMSATLHTTKLSNYFGGIPQIHMGGSCFPVQEFFLEDVLRFTDFVSGKKSFDMAAADGASAVLSTYLQKSSNFFCPICQKDQIFKCPQEFGTHVAMCDPTAGGSVSVKAKSAPSASTKTSWDEFVRAMRTGLENQKASQPTPSAASLVSDAISKAVGAESKSLLAGNEESDDEIIEAEITRPLGGQDDRKVDEEGELGVDGGVKEYLKSHDDSQIDYDLVLELLNYIFSSEFGKEGSVLIFLPGWDDIAKLYREIMSVSAYNNQKYKVIQLHSGIPKKAQNEVFLPLERGEHKIILSTNIAETSITIDDVTVVIDCGRMKEKTYDAYVKLAYLKSTWISKANARQRKGRAGRTKAGVCFHLFTRRRHASLPEYQDSELLRMSLEDVLLQTKSLGVAPGRGESPDSLQGFLSKALDPPLVLSVQNAIQMLQMIGCLDGEENLTKLGDVISQLPLDPRIGRFVLLGCLCGIGPAAVVTACGMGYRDPFIMPSNDHQKRLNNKIRFDLAQGHPSDQISLLRVIENYSSMLQTNGRKQADIYCDETMVSRNTMTYLVDLTQHLFQALHDIGVSPGDPRNARNNRNYDLIMSLIGVGLYPDLGTRFGSSKAFTTEKGRKALIHPASVNSRNQYFSSPCRGAVDLLGYQDLVATSNTAMHGPGVASLLMLNTTPVSVLALLLTCGDLRTFEFSVIEEDEGSDEESDEDEEETAFAVGTEVKLSRVIGIEIDRWLRLKLSRDLIDMIYRAREHLIEALTFFVSNPGKPLPKALSKGLDVIVRALVVEQSAIGRC